MARYHAFQLTYEEVTVLDIPMIFTEARIDRSPQIMEQKIFAVTRKNLL